MNTETPLSPPVSKAARITGWIMSIVPCLLLVFSGVMKLVKPAGMADGFTHLGIPFSLANGLGVLELACTVIYLIPRFSVLGAILLTGYLGGATLTHLRIGEPYFMQPLLGVILWGGLYLRDPRIRDLIPFRK